MEDLLANQATLAAISVYLIQKLKSWARLPLVSETTDRLNRALSLILATLSAAGILVVANWTGFETGTFTLTVTGLTAANITAFAWTMVKSLAMQEVFYRVYKGSKVPPTG